MKSIIPLESVERRIYLIRGHRVMLDRDLADIYGVSTIRLNQQVHRNKKRFPEDFMFQLSQEESLRLQNAISNKGRGGRRYLPYVFTEHGAVMLSAVLHTPVAIEASIKITRAFVRLREMVSAHKDLAVKFAELERKIINHDENIQSLFETIRRFTEPLIEPKPQIGFQTRKK